MFDRQNKSLKHLTFAVEGLAKTSKYKLSKRKRHHSSTSIMAAVYLMLEKKHQMLLPLLTQSKKQPFY